MRVNVEKSEAYRFDANYRRLDYFNNLRNFALNQHTSDTEYRQGDFDLTLLPQNEKLRDQPRLFAQPQQRPVGHHL